MIRLLTKILVLGVFYALIPAVLAFKTPDLPELPDFDKRQLPAGKAKDLPPEKAAAVERLQEKLARSRVDFDEITGSPRFVVANDGFLSGKAGQGRGISAKTAAGLGANEPHRAAKAFLKEHRELFGHGDEVLAETRVKRDVVAKKSGMRTTVWEQHIEGIRVFEGTLIAHTTKAGELVNISSRLVKNPAQAAKAGRLGTLGTRPSDTIPRINPRRAAALAAKNIGEEEPGEEDFTFLQSESGAEQKQKWRSDKLPGETQTRLVWLPMDENSLRLCWEVILTSKKRGETFQTLVDAETGEVLVRRCLTHYLTDATYRVFTSDSPSPFSPGHPAPSADQPAIVPRSLVTLSALNTNASPNGWINDGSNSTIGNNVDAHLDKDDNDVADPNSRPQGSNRVFDFPLDLSQAPHTYTNAVVVNLFYWCNWMHDKLYELGFTEEWGNFQADNFGRGGLGGDAVEADAQDGSGMNNANFTTPPDGSPGRMQMYIFNRSTTQDSGDDRDGSLDAEVMLHEYTHGLSVRLVGGGEGMGALQSEGLGEGWSDFYALALLSESSDDTNGVYPFAGYAGRGLSLPGFDQNYYYGIRRYPYSTDLTKNPLTFKDIAIAQASSHSGVPRSPIASGSADEVHNQGEVWCSALWDLRANLIGKYGHATGNQLSLQLVTDGMKLTPPNPNFLQARDGILLADQVHNNGTNYWDLWRAFAKRGMGFFATSPSSITTVGVSESFALPDDFYLTPNDGLISSGPVGGPFLPNTRTYTITNLTTGTNSVAWTILTTTNWLNLSVSNGVFVPGQGTNLIVSLNTGLVNVMPMGLHTNLLILSNQASGITQTREFVLRVSQPDFYTEIFEASDLDVQNSTFIFTPDGSPSFYSVCREVATNFPVDPAGGTIVSLEDDTNIQVTASASVSLYGTSRNAFFIGSNGYITFGSGDSTFTPSTSSHFDRPRISGLFRDFDPGPDGGGTISWIQTSNCIAVTYQNVPLFGTFNSNNIQIQMGFDGTIRITLLGLAARNGLIGLSAGTGIPSAFVESDFSAFPQCAPPLVITLPTNATEGNGVLTNAGTVTIPLPLSSNLPITFYTSDASEINVPEVVVLPAGATNVAFALPIVDDPNLDGSQAVTIRAVAPGYLDGTAMMAVFDNESAALQLLLPPVTTEGDGVVPVTLSASATPAVDVSVALLSSDTTEVIVPSNIILPQGQTSVVFNMTIVNDQEIDGQQFVNITASVPNWTNGVTTATIRDNENTNLTIVLPASAREGNGTLPSAGIVRISGTLPTNLVVAILTEGPIAAPSSVTIPAGKTWALFDLTIADDSDLDGSQNAEIEAIATPFAPGLANILISDDETPLPPSNPSPANLSTNNSINVDLSWTSGFGEGLEQIVNGSFETGDFTGWTRITNANGNFVINNGAYDPLSEDGPAAPFFGNFSALAEAGGSGTQTLSQDVSIPANAEIVSASWSDRIRNFGGNFGPNQRFHVAIRDTNNITLATIFSTASSTPMLTNWIERSFDISGYRGQTIRLAFIVESSSGNLDVHLDNISVRAANPPLTTYDVYFGTNATPQFLQSTTNRSVDLPALQPLVNYYWRIIANRLGGAGSPTWQFRTVPSLSVSDISVSEGDADVTNAAVSLNLASPSDQIVTVNFATAHGTASASDYTPTNGIVTFAPGETNKMLLLEISGDTTYEYDETFFLTLSSATNAALAETQAVVTIVNDDSPLSPIANKTVIESNLLTFTATATILEATPPVSITDFESFPTNSASGSIMFREPKAHSQTGDYIGTNNGTMITENFPSGHAGARVLRAFWNFLGSTNSWLRFHTGSTPTLPNPTVDLRQAVQFDIYTDRPLRLGLGLREISANPSIGANGGTTGTIEFVGVTNLASSLPLLPNPSRTIAASNWQTLTFNLPSEAVTAFVGGSATGNHVLSSSNGKGVLEHLAIVPVTGDTSAAYNVYLDNFSVIYSNPFTFSLSNAPSGASIHPLTGMFTWTPTEAQGPGVYTMAVQITNNALPPIFDSRTFTVAVSENNSRPTLASISPRTINEGTLLTIPVTANDVDIPTNTLTYSLDASAPSGATINPVTGVLTWTPSEEQGPQLNLPITIRVTDNGNPSLFHATTALITVNEVNRAPVLAPIANRSVTPGTPVSFSVAATDPDIPANALTYSLLTTPPAGANLDPNTGAFTWTPDVTQSPSTNLFTVQVVDDGAPALTNTITFTIRVGAEPVIQSVAISDQIVTITWSSIAGQTYRLQSKTNLLDTAWSDLPGDVTASESTASKDDALDQTSRRFYRVQVVP